MLVTDLALVSVNNMKNFVVVTRSVKSKVINGRNIQVV